MIRWALIFLAVLCVPAHAQKTNAQLITEINTNLASGQKGGITASQLRTTLTDIVKSIVNNGAGTVGSLVVTSPTGGSPANYVCFDASNNLVISSSACTGVTACGAGQVDFSVATGCNLFWDMAGIQ